MKTLLDVEEAERTRVLGTLQDELEKRITNRLSRGESADHLLRQLVKVQAALRGER